MLLALAFLTSVSMAAPLGNSEISFDAFLQTHGKEYPDNKELLKRRATFERTRASVRQQNVEYEAGRSAWWASINRFADATDEELAAIGATRQQKPATPRVPPAGRTVPSSWSDAQRQFKGGGGKSSNPATVSWMSVQTPVRNQGSCGSCWAFAATEALESHLAISANTGELCKQSSKVRRHRRLQWRHRRDRLQFYQTLRHGA